MNDDQFTKLFKYIQDFRTETNGRMDELATKDSVDRLINTIDAFVKRLDVSETEQAVRNAQFDRLMEWAQKVAAKTGVPLPHL